MKCLRCANEDPAYFYKGSKGYYCRRCVKFSRVLLEEEPDTFDYGISEGAGEYAFGYQLTKQQLQASEKCAEAIQEKDVLLKAVCGAGKTEIVVESIAAYLRKGLKVAYAISRREVVIELEKRFRRIFSQAEVVAVYGGHHEKLSADLIVCTCHQLYRYYQSFDLLIIDEADAFPLKGNATLMNIAISSCKGRIIFSTATVDDNLKQVLKKRDYQSVELFTRPSMVPLSIPLVFYLNRFLALLLLFRIMSLTANRCIIFVPAKRDCRFLYRIYRKFFPCTYVYADLKERRKHIEAFVKGKKRFIFATSVLERGITIEGLSTVVILNYHRTFDEGNLVQMLGRVGRGLNKDPGKTYIISDHLSKAIFETIGYLKEANRHL